MILEGETVRDTDMAPALKDHRPAGKIGIQQHYKCYECQVQSAVETCNRCTFSEESEKASLWDVLHTSWFYSNKQNNRFLVPSPDILIF